MWITVVPDVTAVKRNQTERSLYPAWEGSPVSVVAWRFVPRTVPWSEANGNAPAKLSLGGASVAVANAPGRLMMRPDEVFPAREASGRPPARMRLRMPMASLPGNWVCRSAARPDTCGVAIDVPLRFR